MAHAASLPRFSYTPDHAIPPGDTLREALDAIDMAQAELARRADLSVKHVNQIVLGLAPNQTGTLGGGCLGITYDIAGGFFGFSQSLIGVSPRPGQNFFSFGFSLSQGFFRLFGIEQALFKGLAALVQGLDKFG